MGAEVAKSETARARPRRRVIAEQVGREPVDQGGVTAALRLAADMGLLDGPTGVNALVTQISNLLNRILGLLG